jgi:hypothetical protein
MVILRNKNEYQTAYGDVLPEQHESIYFLDNWINFMISHFNGFARFKICFCCCFSK